MNRKEFLKGIGVSYDSPVANKMYDLIESKIDELRRDFEKMSEQFHEEIEEMNMAHILKIPDTPDKHLRFTISVSSDESMGVLGFIIPEQTYKDYKGTNFNYFIGELIESSVTKILTDKLPVPENGFSNVFMVARSFTSGELVIREREFWEEKTDVIMISRDRND